jgi:homoserine kinase
MRQVSLRIPATSANVGCLFDSAALALSLYLKLRVASRADDLVTVRYRGVTPERVPTDESNLIVRTIRETMCSCGAKTRGRGLDLEIDNEIPVGVGLGSSAAAIVGALAACHWLADKPFSDEELVTLAAGIEGHPDNVAAAWHGGFTAAVDLGDRVLACSCPVPDSLRLVLVIPDYALPTEKARAVLPDHYSRREAVRNLQRAVVLAGQFFSGKADFHPFLFDDRWHQPYRAPLVPGLAEALAFTHSGLLGICLSGAGPSILAFARSHAEAIGEAICQTLARHGVRAEWRVLAADNQGAKGWNWPGSEK